MSRIGNTVTHSRYGTGTIVSVAVTDDTPPPIDQVKLDGERWRLRARLAEIDRILTRGTETRKVPRYTVEFDGGRKIELGADDVERLRSRAEPVAQP
jgi:hypothetical protein